MRLEEGKGQKHLVQDIGSVREQGEEVSLPTWGLLELPLPKLPQTSTVCRGLKR